MTRLFPRIAGVLVVLVLVLLALLALNIAWRHYEVDPWTRDGVVEADIVQVSADVSGLVTQVRVHDNAIVHAGDVLFTVDQERYAAQLAQADAAVTSANASVESSVANIAKAKKTLAYDKREAARYTSLGELISRETRDQKVTAVDVDRVNVAQTETQLDQSRASVVEAEANRRAAAVNVDHSSVRAGVDGYVTNFSMRPGDYVQSGSAQFALLDPNSYYVLGYFEETKLRRFGLGDRVRIDLLGDRRPLWGHVDSLAAGIADRQKNPSGDLLPNITPTFSWIQLAQRVPVRVVIDRVPVGLRLVVGRTATVTILPTAAPVTPRAVPASSVAPNTAPLVRAAPPPPAAPAHPGPP